MSASRDHVAALQRLSSEVSAGLSSLDAILIASEQSVPETVAVASPDMEARVAIAIRRAFGPMTQAQWDIVRAALAGAAAAQQKIALAHSDFEWAAAQLGGRYAQIRAVDEVESGGGWFTNVRVTILALDGPDGFLDGPDLPKILFEAHHFDKRTNGKFRANYPNLSSKTWNRALYVGGQGEWERLFKAMQLDETAALLSASVGRYQIMGFNHKLAGFATVQEFWTAQKESERRQLESFVAFIKNAGLLAAFRKISSNAADCIAFAKGYNGSGYAANAYHAKIAAAHRKFLAAG